MSFEPQLNGGDPSGGDIGSFEPAQDLQDPLQAALAAGGQGDAEGIPADHEPTLPGSGLEPVDMDELEQACLRAMQQAARLAAGATDARQLADAGTGAVNFLTVLEKLNADEEQPPAQQVPVMPHAVGMVRQALAADHGVDPGTFDELLLGAHQHLADLQTGGDPTLGTGAPAPTGLEAGPPQPSELGETMPGATTDQGAGA